MSAFDDIDSESESESDSKLDPEYSTSLALRYNLEVVSTLSRMRLRSDPDLNSSLRMCILSSASCDKFDFVNLDRFFVRMFEKELNSRSQEAEFGQMENRWMARTTMSCERELSGLEYPRQK